MGGWRGEKGGSKPSYTSKSAPSLMVLASCGNPHVRVLRDRRCGFAALQSELQTGGGSEAKVLGCWIWLLTSGPYRLPSCSRTPPQPHDMPCFPRASAPSPATLKTLFYNELIWGRVQGASTHHGPMTWAQQCPPNPYPSRTSEDNLIWIFLPLFS